MQPLLSGIASSGTGAGEDACRGDSGGPLVSTVAAHPKQDNVATFDEDLSNELQIPLLRNRVK